MYCVWLHCSLVAILKFRISSTKSKQTFLPPLRLRFQMANPTTLQASLRAHLSPPTSTLSRWGLSSLFLAENKAGTRPSLPEDWAKPHAEAVSSGERLQPESGERSRNGVEEGRRGSGDAQGSSDVNGEVWNGQAKNHDVDNDFSKSAQEDRRLDAGLSEVDGYVKMILVEVNSIY